MKRERYITVLGGYTLDMHNGGKLIPQAIPPRIVGKDYGTDPIGDGMVRMVPSGDIVTAKEAMERLGR